MIETLSDKLKKSYELVVEVFEFFSKDESFETWKGITDNSNYYWLVEENNLAFWDKKPGIEYFDRIFKEGAHSGEWPVDEEEALYTLVEEGLYQNHINKKWEKADYTLFHYDIQVFEGNQYWLFDNSKKVDISKLLKEWKESKK